MIQKGRKGVSAGDWTYVCSNHFIDGAPTQENPTPSLFLTPSDALQKTPQKRKHIERLIERSDTPIGNNHQKISNEAIDDVDDRGDTIGTASNTCMLPSFRFESLTRDSDVRFYTGFINTDIIKTIFEHLLLKATNMNYWNGPRKTYFSPELDAMLSAYPRMRQGPSRKLTLEQEFLLILIKLRVGLLQYDLAHRFGISPGKVSQIFITWIKLLSKELSVLIVWL